VLGSVSEAPGAKADVISIFGLDYSAAYILAFALGAAVLFVFSLFARPRRTARASPCQVLASPWNPSDRQR
jgi:hypothetical protein